MNKTDLSKYNNSDYKIGANIIKRLFWYYTNELFFKNSFFPFYKFKIFLLKLYGAKVGNGVVIKPTVNIKYPWHLKIGNFVWIGENVWIDNLDDIEIGDNSCISQGALLLCGNHNYKKTTFDLIIKKIKIEDGVWIGAKCVVVGGVVCHSHSLLTVNSVAVSSLEPYSIYKGNPAVFIKQRQIN